MPNWTLHVTRVFSQKLQKKILFFWYEMYRWG